MLKKDEIFKIITGTKMIELDEEPVSEELYKIAKELTADENTYRFSNTSKLIIGYDSILGALADRPFYNPKIKARYEFLRSFRYHYHIGRQSMSSMMADRYADLGRSLMGFGSAIDYRKAGLIEPNETIQKKHSILDKLKKG